MIDIDKLVKEFSYLRGAMKKIAENLSRNEYMDAAFTVGVLHAVCENHVMSLTPLISAKPEPVQENVDAVV